MNTTDSVSNTAGELAEPPGLGATIVGDEMYSTSPSFAPDTRLMLHASMLTIYHPVTGKQMTFKVPVPF